MPSPTILSLKVDPVVVRPGGVLTVTAVCWAKVDSFTITGTVTGKPPANRAASFGVAQYPVSVAVSASSIPGLTWTQVSTDGINTVLQTTLPTTIAGAEPKIIASGTDKTIYRPKDNASIQLAYNVLFASVTVQATVSQSGWTPSTMTGLYKVVPETDLVVTDDHGDNWTMVSDDGLGTAFFSTTLPATVQ